MLQGLRILRGYYLRCAVSLLSVAMLGLGACALTEEHINLGYTPTAEANKVTGAEDVTVTVAVQDQRTSPDHVGHKTNGYGMEMAKIVADNDVPTMLRQALETELTNRGFHIGPGSVAVNVTLQKFENHFELGWFSGTARSELIMGVIVVSPTGVTVFTKYVKGDGVNDSVQIAGGNNAKIALEAAMQDAIKKLFEDQAFLKSLVEAGKMSAKNS
ncbi:MAG TPA: YajG family lipoprotein [Candidatus Binataceae bacterium]|nr:YajG family lipoprotein [Candidatus Binataceae bacterium]